MDFVFLYILVFLFFEIGLLMPGLSAQALFFNIES